MNEGLFAKIGLSHQMNRRVAAHLSSFGWFRMGMLLQVRDAEAAEQAMIAVFESYDAALVRPAPGNRESWFVPTQVATLTTLLTVLFAAAIAH